MNEWEFKYPMNLIYFTLPMLGLFFFIGGAAKKDKILKQLNLYFVASAQTLRIVLSGLGLMLISFSLLGPQSFKDFQEVSREGLDIYVLMDTSKSMLVEDIQPNRMDRGKKIIDELLVQLKGDRIGFIPYSSSAYIQMPLTDDYQLARMFLKVMDTDMIGGGGTKVAAAIRLAANSFKETSSSDRIVIILSDGEEHNAESLEAIKALMDKKMKVYTIGLGTQKGGLIPVYQDTDKQKRDYKKDTGGQFVMSKLNSDMLQKISQAGNGNYYQASDLGLETNQILKDISYLKRELLKKGKIKRFDQAYQYFLGAGILLFGIAYLLPVPRRRIIHE